MGKIQGFLEPGSIAVYGASEKENSMGGVVLKNIINAGFRGQLFAVNLRGYDTVFGQPCIKDLKAAGQSVDLCLLCVPPEAVPGAMKNAAKYGAKAVIIMTGGISRRQKLESEQDVDIQALARKLGIRVMGPNAMGVVIPSLKLNASFAHLNPVQGTTAFVGQSAAMGSALMDYAVGRGIGFSHFIAIGAVTDVDMAELIDALAADRRVRSILVNIEQFDDPQKLMTALRAASRTKNVVAIRTGLNEAPPPGLKSRANVDYRFFRRAGVLEVKSLDGLFNGLELLTRRKPMFFESLAIVSNGLGTAMLANNTLSYRNGKLADLSELSNHASEKFPYIDDLGNNPLVVSPRTSVEEYSELLLRLDKVKNLGAILLIISPNIKTNFNEMAEQLAVTVKKCRHMVLTCLLGSETVKQARYIFDQKGLLSFDSPNDAVSAFMTIVHHERNQESLRDTPPESKPVTSPELSRVQAIISEVKGLKRDYLTLQEARSVMQHYRFSLVHSSYAQSLSDLIASLKNTDYPASLRLLHEAYCYPFAYDLNPRMRWRSIQIELQNQQEVEQAAVKLLEEQNDRFPDSKVLGFSLQPMRRRMDSLVFSMGITRDELVGPLILFGEGGSTADVLADRRFALPPLNSNHTRKFIYRSHAFTVLSERSANLENDVSVLSDALKTLSQMAIDQPEIKGLEANVLLLPNHELLVLGVAIQIGEPCLPAIASYPSYLESEMVLRDGTQLVFRPIRAEDEKPLKQFFDRMTPEELRYRFFGSRLQFEHRELAPMCHIDYVREMAFVAVNDQGEILGEVRTWKDVMHDEIEFAVMVAPGTQGQGFGTQLMNRMIDYGRSIGVAAITAEVMADNEPMIRLSRGCGFRVVANEDGVITVRLDLE